MNQKNLILTSLLITTASSALWSQTAMTGASFGNVVDNQSELLSFEANNSGTTLTIASIATTLSDIGGVGWHLGPGTNSNVGDPDTAQVAINDVFVTTNVFGLPNNVLFSLNTTVNAGDGQYLFLTEHIGNDNGITIKPTSGGTAIGSWSLTLDATDYAAITTTLIYDYDNEGNPIAGTVFNLADFVGGTGTLTGVDGLLIDGDGRLDPALIGVAAAVPEPSTFALLGLMGGLMLRRRR